MDSQVKGTVLPVREIVLNPAETVVAETGELSWMTQPIQLKTTTQTGGSKGMCGVLWRTVGGGIFMTEYSADGPDMVAFATKLPGQILPIQVREGAGFLVHRHGSCAPPRATRSPWPSRRSSARGSSATRGSSCRSSRATRMRGSSWTARS